MLAFQPAAQVRPMMGRTIARPLGENAPPPAPDFIFTGYTGVPGFVETLLVLTVTGAAAWVGIREGIGPGNPNIRAREGVTPRVIGWVGGVGSVILGLLYLGGRTGIGDRVGLPSVRVTPA